MQFSISDGRNIVPKSISLDSEAAQETKTALTQLADCGDRLALVHSPACERYTQILRLNPVADFEKGAIDPDWAQKIQGQMIAARATQGSVAQVINCAMLTGLCQPQCIQKTKCRQRHRFPVWSSWHRADDKTVLQHQLSRQERTSEGYLHTLQEGQYLLASVG